MPIPEAHAPGALSGDVDLKRFLWERNVISRHLGYHGVLPDSGPQFSFRSCSVSPTLPSPLTLSYCANIWKNMSNPFADERFISNHGHGVRFVLAFLGGGINGPF